MAKKLKRHEARSLNKREKRDLLSERMEPGQLGRPLLHGGSIVGTEKKPVQPKKTVLIVTEGEKTEPNYFCAMKDYYELTEVDVLPEGKDPYSLTEIAVSKKNTREDSKYLDPYDEVWVVCDTEGLNHPFRKHLQRARPLAKKHGVRLAVSSPSFEYWLLLHYQYTTRSFDSCDDVIAFLRHKKRWPGYAKNAPVESSLFDRLGTACAHAKKLRKDTKVAEPSTDVDLLVVSLIGEKRATKGIKTH